LGIFLNQLKQNKMSENTRKSEFGIWKRQVKLKTGETTEVLSFSVNGVRYNAWPNGRKQNPKSPDYNVYIDTYVKPENGNQPAAKPAVKSDLPF